MRKPLKGLRNNIILTQTQVALLEEFAASELNNFFRLTGGTALSAFYLEHRFSEDLDFFSCEKIPWYLPENFLRSLHFVQNINYTKTFDRNIFTISTKNGTILKIEFTYYPFKNIEAPVLIDGLHVESFIDLILNKLCAIADRSDAKDYVDVYCAFTATSLDIGEIFTLAEQKCEIKGIGHILKSRLLQVPDGVDRLPLRISLTKDDIERFFRTLIKELITGEL